MTERKPRKLSPAQQRMLSRGDHHRADVARSAVDCSAWHRTQESLVRLGLAAKGWPQHPSGGVVFRLVLTPDGERARLRLDPDCERLVNPNERLPLAAS